MENQQLTANDKTPEQIQHEMEQTRDALTEKVAALENQVVGSVQTAADTLTGTVESVRSLMSNAPSAVSDTMKQAAEAVSESMKKTFDISGHVRENPLAAVGVSALIGCVTGWLLTGGRQPLGYSSAVVPPPHPGAPTPTRNSLRETPEAASGPGVFDELFAMLGRKVRELAETVIDTAGAAVNKNVREGVPKLVDAATELAADRLTPSEPAGSHYTGSRT